MGAVITRCGSHGPKTQAALQPAALQQRGSSVSDCPWLYPSTRRLYRGAPAPGPRYGFLSSVLQAAS